MTIVLIVLLFLVVMAVMSIFARIRTGLPGQRRGKGLSKANQKCPKCGAYRIGKGKCACGRG